MQQEGWKLLHPRLAIVLVSVFASAVNRRWPKVAKRSALQPIRLDWEELAIVMAPGIWLAHRALEVSPSQRLQSLALPLRLIGRQSGRSEERRVGKEGRCPRPAPAADTKTGWRPVQKLQNSSRALVRDRKART